MSTTHFSPETDPRLFACGCHRPECDAPPPSSVLLAMLEVMRRAYGSPITVTSGPRCAYWNAHEKGRPDSEHLTGEAADLACASGMDRWAMIEALRATGFQRYGIGATFLHVGVSRTLAQRVVWGYYPRA